jgi:Flp pilus assembly pilin Flp
MVKKAIAHAKTSLHALHGTMRAPRAGALSLVGEEGVVTTEYALLLALVAMAVIAAAIVLGLAVASLFQTGASGIPNG